MEERLRLLSQPSDENKTTMGKVHRNRHFIAPPGY